MTYVLTHSFSQVSDHAYIYTYVYFVTGSCFVSVLSELVVSEPASSAMCRNVRPNIGIAETFWTIIFETLKVQVKRHMVMTVKLINGRLVRS